MQRPPKWIEELVRMLSAIAPAEICGHRGGWCCAKHELDFSPDELDIYDVEVQFKPHQDPEVTLRHIYDVAKQGARAAKTHEVVHFQASPSGFVLSIKPTGRSPDDKGGLNVDI